MRSLVLDLSSIAALSLTVFPMWASAASLNECKLPDGRTVLLWEKCPEGEQGAPASKDVPAAAPRLPAAQAPKSPAGPFATPSARQMDREMVVEIMSGYAVCAEDVEGFRARFSAAYDFWKLRNTAAIGRVQDDPAARTMIAERIAEGRSSSGGTEPEKRNYCEKLIGPFLTGKFAGAAR